MVAVAVGAPVALAWVALIAWGASPYARYLDHGSIDSAGVAPAVAATIFAAGWVLMIVAMMLPTAYPVVALFGAVTRSRDDRILLLTLCVAGYLVVWGAFGYVAYAGDLVLHDVVDAVPWLSDHEWIIGAATLALAGGYQFTQLKYRCLDACRSPRMFVVRHWTGRRQRYEAFALGVDSGKYCLGCCWSLMLVMFAVGGASVPLMLGLGSVMAVEKNAPWGTRVSAPLGITLLVAAVVVLARGAIA